MVDSGKREVRLSQIFKWYKADFGGTDENVGLTPAVVSFYRETLNQHLKSLFMY